MSAVAALREFESVLVERVNGVRESFDEDPWLVDSRFGSSYDWDDPAEGAFFLWRREGFDPNLLLPRPQLTSPDPAANSWRTCVAFDEQSIEYWFAMSTAVLFAGLNWGSLSDARLMPSLGGTGQGESGLMGAFRVCLPSSRAMPKRLHDGRVITSSMWEVVTVGDAEPVWDQCSFMASRTPAPQLLVPSYYWDDFYQGQESFPSRRECLGALLPDDVRSPFLMGVGSAISYSVGWLALVHGLKTVVDNWQEVNAVLASAPLVGFVPPA